MPEDYPALDDALDLFTGRSGLPGATHYWDVRTAGQLSGGVVPLNYRAADWNVDVLRVEDYMPADVSPIAALPVWQRHAESIPDLGVVGQVGERVSATPTRLDRIVAALLQQETLDLLKKLAAAADATEAHEHLLRFAVSSTRELHIFARLVAEDLVALDEASRLHLTAFAERVIHQIATSRRET